MTLIICGNPKMLSDQVAALMTVPGFSCSSVEVFPFKLCSSNCFKCKELQHLQRKDEGNFVDLTFIFVFCISKVKLIL